MTKTLRRWRTWIFNSLAAVTVLLPELINAVTSVYWGDVIPPKYLPYFAVFVALVNIWMRPRAAVLPHDDEAQK